MNCNESGVALIFISNPLESDKCLNRRSWRDGLDMPKKTVVVPTQKILNSLKTVGNYARHPYGIAVIGSISLHVVAAVALPGWSESEENIETGAQEVVRVVDLPADVQSRLPSMAPSIDLSVFENNPDFNIDMSAIGNGTIPSGLNGLNGLTGIDGNTFALIPGTGNLQTPFAPSPGQVNYSFVPNSPPAIASRFIAPPPPNSVSGFLPPPPGVPAFSGSGNIFNVPINPNNANASIAPASGNQQVFSINTQPRSTNNTNSDLVQRQRQLENEAAIALSPSTFAPGDPDIRFNAELLQPSDLKNPASLLPRPQAQPVPTTNTTKPPQTVARNSSTISKSIRGNYPKSACSSQASGTATYNVVVTPSGAPSQWSLSSSSGNNSLDNQASQDIRNVSFDGANSSYRVSVGYTYQPSFCAAFKPQPQAPAAPKPPATATPAPQPASPAPLVIEVPESKPAPPPAPVSPAPTPPAAPTSPPKPAPVAPAPTPPAAPAAPAPAPSPASTPEE